MPTAMDHFAESASRITDGVRFLETLQYVLTVSVRQVMRVLIFIVPQIQSRKFSLVQVVYAG